MERPWLRLIGAIAALCGAMQPCQADDGIAFFEAKIRPVLADRCYRCHSASTKQSGGLVLDSAAGWKTGGDSGPALVPGKPDQSLLLDAVRGTDPDFRMPPEGEGERLTPAQIADFEAWIKLGAPDPRVGAAAPAAKTWAEIFAGRKQWWSLQPGRAADPPTIDETVWSQNEVDAFLRARTRHEGIAPSGLADPRTLVRRATLVLTGLPPTPQEVAAYVAASKQGADSALAALVDRLLASPHFGERFARHWLDVVHFSETSGSEFNYDVPFAWRYRDYVIRAFNADLPYDQFVREHIAGDLLAQPRWNAADKFNESVIGTAFYRFGEVSSQSCVEFPSVGMDIADGQLDTLTKAFQASTVACARCHDHKLDAISTKDYYALLGILRSSRSVQHTLDGPEVNRDSTAQLRQLKAALRAELAAVWRKDAAAIDAAKLSELAAAGKESTRPISDPLHAWGEVRTPGKSGAQDVAARWRALGREQAEESARRLEFNHKNFVTLADFRNGTLNGWSADGMGLRDGPGRSGDFTVAHEGNGALGAVLPAGAFTFALSDELNGALRSPVLHRTHSNVSFQILGGHNSLARLVFNNCQLAPHYKSLHHAEWTWVTVPFPGNTDSLRPYAELVTFWDNPKFPEPQGDSDKDSGVQRSPWSVHAKNPRTWWGVRRIVVHNGNEPPKDELTYLARLFGGNVPTSADEVAARYAQIASQAVEAFAADRATDDDVCWLQWLVKNRLLANQNAASPRLAQLVAQYRDVEQNQISLPRMIAGVADEGDGFDHPVLVRGDYTKPGTPVERRYLEVLYSRGELYRRGSGRLALAEALTRPENPFTARVMVNRVWQWLFGAGLVRTPDDFGHLGEKPSHPELLEHLTAQFIADGWSVKKLVRSLVLTRAFQLDAVPTQAARERDPQNILLTHYSARRAEAEVIRDSILAVSGRLDPTLLGPSVHPYRERDDTQLRLFAGPLDGDGRRSIYLKVQLIEATRFLSAFNLPGGKVVQGRRDNSNVPAQSLALLNDPFVLAMADFWAGRLVTRKNDTVAGRASSMFETALGRVPTASEREVFVAAVRSFAQLRGVAEQNVLASRVVWKDSAHALFNFKELIFIP
jgi:hypothetical protein